MGETAEGLRQDIEDTRSAMSGTLEAIGDRVSPGRILERRRNRMMGWVRDAKDKVMGTADQVTNQIGEGAHHIRSAPSTAVDGMASGTRETPTPRHWRRPASRSRSSRHGATPTRRCRWST